MRGFGLGGSRGLGGLGDPSAAFLPGSKALKAANVALYQAQNANLAVLKSGALAARFALFGCWARARGSG